MASYHFNSIEKNWQKYWAEKTTFKAENNSEKPKYYVLDMFPYPSGAGLHVGHPLGYIASDIVARFKRHNGFNVLHPMGYDAFGLPAEQYAIQTGQHPEITTKENIARYRQQLDNIGFSFDWSREICTTDKQYYKWTQWIFIQLFNSWYNPKNNKAENISILIQSFEQNGYQSDDLNFTKEEWHQFSEKQQSDILLQFRLAFLSETMVNWCPALGSVLANDEIKDGVSERGGYPVERKLMTQWSLRISAYADRLLKDLDALDWSDSIKEAQRNWIGKSEGCSIKFEVENNTEIIEVFTTRPDTIFGVSYLTLAPENDLVLQLTHKDFLAPVLDYIDSTKKRSERERQADVKNITGVFTGTYAIHPFTGKQIPIWVGDYVLAGYGTGAVMAVPAHDSRDYAFAKHFNLPIIQVVEGGNLEIESYDAKIGKLINSDFLNSLEVKDAIKKAIETIEQKEIGKGKTNFRLRDAIFGRQRYWGEPIPIYYENGIPKTMNEEHLPLVLPEIDKFLPTETGEPPLARAANWQYCPHPPSPVGLGDELNYDKEEDKNIFPIETTTMPGWAGSSWYYLRYMDANNTDALASKEAINYWQNIDLYVGGSEHAVGHLLYSRFWCKFLKDIDIVPFEEPFNKLVNQGMIQGISMLIYRVNEENKFVSFGLKDKYQTTPIHIDINLVSNNIVNLEGLKKWRPTEFLNAEFELENGSLICGNEVGKMSKRWHNVVNPDDICAQYGADTLRLYEMFLGPLQDAKPWSTQGIEGVHRFLKKTWRLFHNNTNEDFDISNAEPTKAELKILHKTIKKATEDIENFSFNTSVSAFMVCVNELQDLKCNKRAILEPFIILLSPYAPHITEELWHLCGNAESISQATWPMFNAEYLIENEFNYPISFNGKVKFNLNFALDKDLKEIENEVIANEQTQKILEGKAPKKVIVVKGRIVNVVI